jgi:hypothetical protein
MALPGGGRSAAVWILSECLKMQSGAEEPIPTALLRHYVGGSGEPYDLNQLGNIPEEWQTWIVNATRARPGSHPHINGENAQKAGLDDLSDSLGHFTVVVAEKECSSARIYEIKKEGKERYQFGFTPNDRARKGRHGFRFHLSDAAVAFIRAHLMPTRKYDYGHFKNDEQFEISETDVKGRYEIRVAWYVLVRAGKPFNVYGRFER